jgi:hypothetical protein
MRLASFSKLNRVLLEVLNQTMGTWHSPFRMLGFSGSLSAEIEFLERSLETFP